jgi:malate dehydrogenase (oxaloacetate-decarboxylating)
VSIDFTYRLKAPHRPGSLARITGEIGKAGALIGDVTTRTVGRKYSIRDLTVAVKTAKEADSLAERLGALDDVEVAWFRDRALMMHEGGKLEIDPVRAVRTFQDVRDAYTPGVARACAAIEEDPATARVYTMIGRTVAICTNGTRVLGLGSIGPRAAMPVMEGKAVFYRQFAGISAMPILLDTEDVDEFVEAVVRIAPTFGGIHLEDICAPECFEIEARIDEALPDHPVMHDDVHGTAVVTLAAGLVASRQSGVDIHNATVGQIGLGAAGFGIASLMIDGGASRVIAADPNEASHAKAEAKGIEIASLEDVMQTADVVVATTGKPGLIDPKLVREGQVILALSNPEPEIDPEAAKEAGAAFASDGTEVNNVLGYPGIFRGALLADANRINVEMKLAAALAIAGITEESELVPDVLDPEVHQRVAEAVRSAAIESGVGRADAAPAGLE